MEKEQYHIMTKNYVRIQKKYLDTVIAPCIATLTETVSPIKQTYHIGGNTITIYFYSPLLAEKMTPALAHLLNSGDTPTLTIHVFDSVSTQTTIASPWKDEDYTFSLTRDNKKSVTDAFLGVCIYGENTINIYDRTTATAYFWIHDAGMLPDWIVAAPLRTIFNWFLSEHHIHLMHGAVIGTTAGALLLTAKGGSGKSTTALTSVLAGMNYLSDDYVGVGLSERITAHSLYNSAKITADALYRFPELETQFKAPQTAGEKSIVFLSSIFPEQIKSYSPLRAIMIPRISKAHDQDTVTRITPATKIQALLAILPTTLFQLPLAGLDQVPQLRTIIDRTPCYFLELGSDISTIPAILKAHLND